MGALSELRAIDRDRYLACLFLPDGKQQDVATLCVFAAELARIPSLVSEPQIGEIRLQWWSDTLEAIGRGEGQDHPLAQALAGVVARHSLPIAPLLQLVEARRFDLYADQMESVTALEAYLGETDAALFQLSAMIVAPGEARLASEASGLAGVALGLSRLVGSAKHVPLGLDAKAHVLKRLAEARDAVNALPAGLRAVYLPLALTEFYLAGVVSPLQKQWRLWRVARRGSL